MNGMSRRNRRINVMETNGWNYPNLPILHFIIWRVEVISLRTIRNSKRIRSNLFAKFSKVHSWVQIVNQKFCSVCITPLRRLSKSNKAQYKCFARPALQSSNKTDSPQRTLRRNYRFFAHAYKDHALLCALNTANQNFLKNVNSVR